ncbi:MAG: WecB/TagA/CpsF family glycosyltransferase [Nitrospiraceae bacterium]|nr:WecB/TagA/CpsF family glycosyltransferase [Nitrospiraceae bacterium]
MEPLRVEVLDVPVDCVTMDQAVQWADARVSSAEPKAVIAVNPEKVMKAQSDPDLLRLLRSAGLLIPDGIGVVFATRFLRLGYSERVPGAELMPRLCALAAAKGYRVFLFGASPDVNLEAAARLREEFPGLNIVGTQHGYVQDAEMPAVLARINEGKPDFLFIALGSPRQELWMARFLPQLQVKVCQGVGGTFDVLAGKVKRAPWLFRTIHLEWLYRLLSQPSRLARQTALPLFAFQILRKRVLG